MAKTREPSGIQRPQPRCPGDRKAGLPPSRRELGGQLPDWLNPASAKWTTARIAREFGPTRRPTPRAPSVGDRPPGPSKPAPDNYRIG
jgi:hypothetical protein